MGENKEKRSDSSKVLMEFKLSTGTITKKPPDDNTEK